MAAGQLPSLVAVVVDVAFRIVFSQLLVEDAGITWDNHATLPFTALDCCGAKKSAKMNFEAG